VSEKIMRILVVEDEGQLADIIKRGLEEQGYAVDAAYDGKEGEYLAENFSYDLIVLDIILPKKDGIEVCQTLRQKKLRTPILMLTCKGSVEDKVKGLDSGADDYLVKPFAFEELAARVRALLRREGTLISSKLVVGNLVMDTATRQVWRGERRIELTHKEYAILEYLMRHPNIVVTRTMLEQHVWDMEFDSISNLIDVYIRRLRSKIDEGEKDSLIQTVRGAGYRIKTP
jgi:DNA-binding response OmpR family regulator